jgi:AraC-like DNA-binding protein
MSDSAYLVMATMLDNLHSRIFVARWTKINPARWRLKNVQNTFWRFYLNQSDGAFLELNGKDEPNQAEAYPLEAGRAYFIPAGVRFDTNITREVDHFFVHFDVLGVPDVVMQTIFNGPICLPASDRLRQAVLEIPLEQPAPRQVDLILECRLKAIIYEGLFLYLQTLPPEQIKQPLEMAITLKPVLPAINHINANLANSLFNRDLAELCQMNEDYFIRRFKECLGKTPGDYIREQRVKLAAQQLLFTGDSIEQIASTAGFGSRFYLSRVFKNVIGLSPAAYRKASRV